jgi:hypothetical protein
MGAKMRYIASAILLALGGCVSADTQLDILNSQTPPSPAIKAATIAYVRTSFFDPYSIRDAAISNVVVLPGTGLRAVCIRANSKNRMGGYTGISSVSLRLQGDSVVSAIADPPGCYTSQLEYRPFPELEAL